MKARMSSSRSSACSSKIASRSAGRAGNSSVVDIMMTLAARPDRVTSKSFVISFLVTQSLRIVVKVEELKVGYMDPAMISSAYRAVLWWIDMSWDEDISSLIKTPLEISTRCVLSI